MAYRKDFNPGFDLKLLEMFAPAKVMQDVEAALKDDKKVELEHSSFNDPEDYTKVLIDGISIHSIPGY